MIYKELVRNWTRRLEVITQCPPKFSGGVCAILPLSYRLKVVSKGPNVNDLGPHMAPEKNAQKPGDAFDAKIVRHLVSPALGAGSQMRSLHKVLHVPNWIYAKLERWHHLSFLKTGEVMNMLGGVRAQAVELEKLQALLHLIRDYQVDPSAVTLQDSAPSETLWTRRSWFSNASPLAVANVVADHPRG